MIFNNNLELLVVRTPNEKWSVNCSTWKHAFNLPFFVSVSKRAFDLYAIIFIPCKCAGLNFKQAFLLRRKKDIADFVKGILCEPNCEGVINVVLAVQKAFSHSGRAGRLCLMGKYIRHRLVARPERNSTFWTDRTIPCFDFHQVRFVVFLPVALRERRTHEYQRECFERGTRQPVSRASAVPTLLRSKMAKWWKHYVHFECHFSLHSRPSECSSSRRCQAWAGKVVSSFLFGLCCLLGGCLGSRVLQRSNRLFYVGKSVTWGRRKGGSSLFWVSWSNNDS